MSYAIGSGIFYFCQGGNTMEMTEEQKKTTLIQAWEDRDDAAPKLESEGPKLCKIDNPDCEACQ